MNERYITEELLSDFREFLLRDEKSAATIQKYMRDVRKFCDFAENQNIDKDLVLAYKASLRDEFAITSANSMIAALNVFLCFAGWHDLRVKRYKVQHKIYCPEEKEISRGEFQKLIKAARKSRKSWLAPVMQTIAGTGIRVSELEHITVEAVRSGEAVVRCKGKSRDVFIVMNLRRQLMKYIKKEKISEGPVFVNKHGNPLDRSTIWREMKKLCKAAGIAESKVFPHNLRHLFAKVFYDMEKDIAKLADILGHSSINTTRVYIITSGAEHKKKMESMKLIM